ncbi:DUF922 domain-containing protein [Robiginitalea sp. SC105]|uniref:DUF922 domain-containing protein n=1 Tax=Robiginitalea sp. SC105 TaxID=2762332 RepID=UPI00163A6858|nr:DUF922 domain-containing protein [Robiginitalea sp. SC105]MBC2840162.1 DUF922 domain-containing protein [Robiginitalea sp. SC105]
MDYVRRVIGLIFLGICPLALTQETAPIRWEPDSRLAWSDFRAEPPQSRRVAATTASGISYNYKALGSQGGYSLDFEVSTFFYPDKSWYHPELCDQVVLSHEQLHFDISELFARKFRGRLRGGIFTENVKAEVRRIFTEVNRELSDFQNRYDAETDYSRNRAAQQQWNEAVAALLAEPEHPE